MRIRPEMGGFAGEMKAGVAEAFSSVDAALSDTAAGTQRVAAGFDDILVRSKETVAAFTQQKNSLLEEARTYNLLAQAAAAGSEEQVAAANLAARAEKTLAASYGVVAAAAEESALKASAATKGAAEKTEASAAAMKKAFAGLGALGGLLAGGLIGKFAYDSAKDAASVQKSNEVIREQFGRSADAVSKFAEDAGVKLGIPVHMTDAVSAKFGILFNNLHIGQGQAATMTVGLEKLGGSLAAIRGIDPSQALQSLNMAMLGNMRSLKQLGLSFSNAQISQEAMRLGIVKTASSTNAGKIANEALAIARARLTDTESKYAANTTQVASAQKAVQEAQDKVTASTTKAVGALTPAAKAQAIYALATQNLTGYQKDAAAHADDFANVQRRLSAEFDRAREELGAKLLPAMSVLIGYLADDLPKEIGAVTGFFERFRNVFVPLVAAIGAMVTAWIAYTAAMKIAFVAQTAFNIVMDANPVAIVALAIVGLAAALAVLYERSNTVRNAINQTWGFLRDATVQVWGAIRTYVLAVWDIIETYVVTELKAIRDAFNVFKDLFTGDWRGAWNNVKKLFSDVWDGISRIAADVLEVIRAYVEKKALEIGLAIIEPFTHIPKWLGGGWAQDLKSSMTATLDGLKDPANKGGQGIGDSIKSGVQTGLGGLDLVVANAVNESVGSAAADSPGRAGGSAARTTGASAGATFTQGQMAALLVKAGASPQLADILANIGHNYESSGRSGAISGVNSNGTRDYGLFQINSSHGYSTADMLNPLKNAQEALAIYHSQGFRAWTEAGGRAAAAQYGNWLGQGGSMGGPMGGSTGGSTDPGLVVGQAAKKAKAFTAKQIASAQDSLDQTLKGIIHNADVNGVALTGTVKKHLDDVRSEIGGISSAQDVTTARDHLKNLSTAVADQVAALKTHLSLESAFQTVVVQIKKLGDDSTPQIAAQMAKIRGELAKAVTPTEVAKVKAQMTTLKNEISKQLEAVKQQVDLKKSLFDAAWQRLASGADSAFDRATQAAVKNMQVTVQGAFASFQFGGSVTQTPAEQALADLTAAHDAAANAAKEAADQQAVTDARVTGDAAQVLAAQQALDEDAYQDKVAALQRQATLERDAATTQLQNAQDAYTQQRDLLKQQLDDRVAAIEAGMLNGSIAAAAGMADLTAVLGDPQYGIDVKNSGIVLGGQLYQGLSDALAPTFKMLNDLIDLMAKAGLLKKPTAADLPGAIAAAGGLGAFLGIPTSGPIVVPGFSTDASGQIIRAIDNQTKTLSNTDPPTVTVNVNGDGTNRLAKKVAR